LLFSADNPCFGDCRGGSFQQKGVDIFVAADPFDFFTEKIMADNTT